MEGLLTAHPGLSLSLNPLQNLIQTDANSLGADSQHSDAFPRQPIRTSLIVQHPIRMIVAHTVHLDGHLRRRAIKVENVRPDRMLPPKLEARERLTS